MCQFGPENNIIKELNVSKENSLIGWRNNIIVHSFDDKEKMLKSLNIEYIYPKDKDAEGIALERFNSLGIYNYNNYNYSYNYNYNNYTYNNYNYNNYNYNYNYNNYNKYNYNNYYNIQVKTLHYGKIFEYQEGYRSEFCKITHLIILDKYSKWFEVQNTIRFANHFNNLCEQLAKEYHCDVIEYSKRS